MEHVHLLGVLVTVFKEVDVHRQADFCRAPLLLPVDRDTGVQGDAVDPRLDVTAMLKVVENFLDVQSYILE